MSKIIPIANQKGGTGKTATSINLGIGLANAGKKVLIVDADPQADATTCLGWYNQDKLDVTLATIMEAEIRGRPMDVKSAILFHHEGVDLLPGSIELSSLEMSLVTAMSREKVLKNVLSGFKKEYDYILIDCPPTLGIITINALTAANSVVIPVQSQYLSTKGMTQLIRTIGRVKADVNPSLKIDGILITLADYRTTMTRSTIDTIHRLYGKKLNIFQSQIPLSVAVTETSALGKSIYTHDKNGKAAEAYRELTEEVIQIGEKIRSKSAVSR